jgi:hypothetical protein
VQASTATIGLAPLPELSEPEHGFGPFDDELLDDADELAPLVDAFDDVHDALDDAPVPLDRREPVDAAVDDPVIDGLALDVFVEFDALATVGLDGEPQPTAPSAAQGTTEAQAHERMKWDDIDIGLDTPGKGRVGTTRPNKGSPPIG